MAPISRREFLSAAGIGAGGLVIGSQLPRISSSDEANPENATVPFFGRHQSGITTPQQQFVRLVAFDFFGNDRDRLAELLRHWSTAAAALTQGKRPGGDVDPLGDSGEVNELDASRLTLTFGFGPPLFGTSPQQDRFGFGDRRPSEFSQLPSFAHDELQPSRVGGDLIVQACADDPTVAFHATRTLARVAKDYARMRWAQDGAGPASILTKSGTTPRNLFGQRDGTRNLRVEDENELAQHVWVEDTGSHAWMTGGTYLVVRRIRMQIEVWDQVSRSQQDKALGRNRETGAPFGGEGEKDKVDLAAKDASGNFVIPADAHVRLAAPESNGGVKLLRRAYNFDEGVDAVADTNAGLIFIAFVKDVNKQFIPMLRKLSEQDALHKFLRHQGSGVFFCPPGAQSADPWVGASLFG